MIAFVGSQMAQTDWVVPQDQDEEASKVLTHGDMNELHAKKYVRSLGHPDTTLDSEMWTTVDKNGDGLLQPLEFRELLNELEATAVSTISHRADVAPLWMYAMIIEHMVFLTRVALLSKFPVVPGWIAKARELLAYRTNQMKQEAKKREHMIASGHFGEEVVSVPKGSLHVTVIEAEGLPKMSRFSKSLMSCYVPARTRKLLTWSDKRVSFYQEKTTITFALHSKTQIPMENSKSKREHCPPAVLLRNGRTDRERL